ncbi:hypothetical protein ACFU9X_31435 [Streptomyces atratus]|uniref:hypothetical protein n=1 Tax=Streptomyces atratus TaxID=1893 RepID=UPI003686B38A
MRPQDVGGSTEAPFNADSSNTAARPRGEFHRVREAASVGDVLRAMHRGVGAVRASRAAYGALVSRTRAALDRRGRFAWHRTVTDRGDART